MNLKFTNADRPVSVPFNARTIDVGTRDLNAVLHASANASCTKPCTYFFLKQSSHVVYAGLKFMIF